MNCVEEVWQTLLGMNTLQTRRILRAILQVWISTQTLINFCAEKFDQTTDTNTLECPAFLAELFDGSSLLRQKLDDQEEIDRLELGSVDSAHD